MTTTKLFDIPDAQWPDLKAGNVPLVPVRVGMNRFTGKMLIGWPHVAQSIGLIFATRFHQRVLRRWVGSFVPHLLGENIREHDVVRFYWAIATSLDLWEPNYSVQQIFTKLDQAGNVLTTADDARKGNLKTAAVGVYRPRGHLGDMTPEQRRQITIRR